MVNKLVLKNYEMVDIKRIEYSAYEGIMSLSFYSHEEGIDFLQTIRNVLIFNISNFPREMESVHVADIRTTKIVGVENVRTVLKENGYGFFKLSEYPKEVHNIEIEGDVVANIIFEPNSAQ